MGDDRAPVSGASADATRVALLTGGKDRHYVIGLLRALGSKAVLVDCVAGDEIEGADVGRHVRLVNLVGGQDAARSLAARVRGVAGYYARLLGYVCRTRARVVHVLWFRKFERTEGVVLTALLRLAGKKIVFTAHNVDADARDGTSTRVRRLALRALYRAVHHILVHTEKMQDELCEQFGVARTKVTVVPFGVNDVIPRSALPRLEARRRLGLHGDDRVLLFFGTIVPYKGVDDLLRAVGRLVKDGKGDQLRVVIAGPVWSGAREYWSGLERLIESLGLADRVRTDVRFEYIPDEEVGVFFRAADVSVLPYRNIYQSGVLALSYFQGVPVIVADVGSLGTDVIDGKTGLLFAAGDDADLAAAIQRYFASDLYANAEGTSRVVRDYGMERFSWSRNADLTADVYRRLLAARA
jgi:D-inositol-3-phosphate glycosyltransferase